MLTDGEFDSIKKIAAIYPLRQAAAAEALMSIQAGRGWISDEILIAISEVLGMTTAELDSIATFYSQIFRRPVGKHIIRMCDGVSCWIKESSELISYVQKLLSISFGQTTIDGLFTVLPISCLGVCEQAPAMMIDETVFGNLTEKKVEEIISLYSKQVKQ